MGCKYHVLQNYQEKLLPSVTLFIIAICLFLHAVRHRFILLLLHHHRPGRNLVLDLPNGRPTILNINGLKQPIEERYSAIIVVPCSMV